MEDDDYEPGWWEKDVRKLLPLDKSVDQETIDKILELCGDVFDYGVGVGNADGC
jgi:hypothetical protein